MMRRLLVLAAVAFPVFAVSCSDDAPTNAGQPLEGVDDSNAERLCDSYFAVASDLTLAQEVSDTQAMDTAIDSYGGVERSAKDVGAVAFAATVHNAATTARVLVGGQTRGGETDTSARQEIMRSILRVRLADTTLRLACAERGQFEPPFDS